VIAPNSGKIAASGGEVNGLGSSKAHHVCIGPQEDRSGCTCTLGEDTGCEEEG
jgi:hypothetical protein